MSHNIMLRNYPLYTINLREEIMMKNKRTNITIKKEQEDLWKWTFSRARQLQFHSVSDYLFDLIKKDKESIKT